MIRILYEDRDLLVCEKPSGVLSQPDGKGADEDMIARLAAHLREQGARNPYVGLVHRLDRGVGGVMVFAKHSESAERLSQMIAQRQIEKQYLAVVHGAPETREGVLADFLYKDAATNKSYVAERTRPGAKRAELSYRALETRLTPWGEATLVLVRLQTGRTHQIRVQFSSRALPLIGDGKYGARDHGVPIGLWSYRLTFAHPYHRDRTVDVACPPEGNAVFAVFSADAMTFHQ